MARFSVQIPSLLGGVSQQAPQLRLVGQAESMVNAYPSLVDGLMRRHPIEHVAAVDDLSTDQVYPSRDDHVHVINRDPDERYMVVLNDGLIQVVALEDGTPYLVLGPNGDSLNTDYLELGSNPATTNFKCITIADYTLVLNRLFRTGLSTDLTGPDPSDAEAFLFVRAGNYSTTYSAFLTKVDVEYEVSVTTWDGQALSSGTAEEWELTIVTPGSVGANWSVTILGNTATYTVQPGDNAALVAAGLASAISALANVSATNLSNVITIVADLPGVHFTPTVGGVATTGTYSLSNTVVGENADELASIDTSDIAQAILDKILALPGSPFTAERLGAVVHVESDDVLTTVRTEDGHDGLDFIKVHKVINALDSLPLVGVDGFTIRIDGGTAGTADDYYVTFRTDTATVAEEWELTILAPGDVGKAWKVTILGNSATYTVQAGDSTADVATGLAAAIDALDSVTASAAGEVITIVADDPGPHIDPMVHEATRGDFTLVRTTDSIGSFGAGKWTEGRGFNIPVGVDATTMPWRLIRRQDDDAGTITGTPLGKWFEWSPNEWVERQVGDQDSAPDPSLVGDVIEDMFFFRDRLGFTAGQKVVMSEVGRFFNLYRTTVLSLPDSDPIDITVPSKAVVRIHRAVPLERRLILFADDTQFALDGDPILTPQTVQVAEAGRTHADSESDPVSDAEGLYFASSRTDFGGVRRLFPQEAIEGHFLSEDTTVAVPQFIAGPVLQMAVIEPEGLLVCLAENDRRALYLYKTLRIGDQRLQSAWFRYDLGENAIIQGFGTVGNTLHLLVHRNIAAYLERSVIQSDLVDEGADYLTHYDRRVTLTGGSYSNITGRTSWTVPYRYDSDEVYSATTKSTTGVDGGDVHPLQHESHTLETTVFSTQGDLSAETLWAGQEFETRYEFSKLYLKSDAPAGGQALRTGGRLQVLHGSLIYERTAALSVEVTPRLRATRVAAAPFSGMSVQEALIGALSLPANEFRFPVLSSDAEVEIVADGPLPMAIQAAQFEVEWSPRMGVYRGQ
jgi:hypothetical protein